MATKDATSRKGASNKKTAAAQKKSSAKRPARKTSGSATKKAASKTSAPKAESRRAPKATELAKSAARELLELTGKGAESITGLERTDDGWVVQVEVVEVRRIPDTTDVLALYEVTTDDRGGMQGYRRVKRYARGVPGEE